MLSDLATLIGTSTLTPYCRRNGFIKVDLFSGMRLLLRFAALYAVNWQAGLVFRVVGLFVSDVAVEP